MISDRWREAVRLEPGTRTHHILWPASCPGSPPRARVPAHALAALVFLTAICQTYMYFYWADDPQADDARYQLLWYTAVMMAVPILLMGLALARARSDRRGVWSGLVAAAGWVLSVLTTPLLLLAPWAITDGSYCTAGSFPPEHPLSGSVLPTAVVVALAAGSAAAWTVSVLARGRARPADRYRVWLTTITVTVVMTLAPWLRAAETCRSGA